MAAYEEPTTAQRRTLAAYVRTGSQKAAAHELGISPQTVKNELASLYVRLGVSGVLEALNALGWVHPEDPYQPCGWVGYCGRPLDHGGQHGGFRPLLREPEAEQ